MSLIRSSATRRKGLGFTLIEMMVALVVSALAATGIYEGFISTSNAFRQTKAEGNAWQQARAAVSMITQAVESAGYGLPMTDCSQIYSNNFQSASGGPLLLAPVSAQTPTPANLNTYDPAASPINAVASTYELQTVTGGGMFGSAPTTYISKVNSTTAAAVQVQDPQLLQQGDLFLVTMPNAVCLLGQITNPVGSGSSPTVTFNSGAAGSIYNVPNGFSAIDPAVSAAQLANAGFINLGQGGFRVDNFYVGYRNVTATTYNDNSVPSLYMQQYTAATTSGKLPSGILVARGVVDMQVEFGYGTQGTVTSWGPPGTQPANDVDAVKVALVVRDTRVLPHAGTRAGNTITVFANAPGGPVNYVIPTALPSTNTTGCLAGNCSHYLYRVFKTVIPVRNVIWGQP
ncbi:PilW family protein [Acidiferrobacter sp.]|uniref:PilW family protein n=1 Tax=Acidiferrobacter sp. TaxID=1872107 RepID=UPI0026196AC3|nr:PilW family protein [Acidiferrobacter sp.]